MNLHVVTRCTRPENLRTIHESFKGNVLTWHVVFDVSAVSGLDTKLLGWLHGVAQVYFKHSLPGSYMYPEMNELVKSLPVNDLVTLIDDDNIMHPDYYDAMTDITGGSYNTSIFCYNQLITVDNPTYRHASPGNTVVGGIDLAQYTFTAGYINSGGGFGYGYCGDGEFAQSLYAIVPSQFEFIDKTLCYYNYLQQVAPKKTSAPKVLYIGEGKPELKSISHLGYEDTSLNTYYNQSYKDTDPDAIVTIGGNAELHDELFNAPLDIRKRWLHFSEEPKDLGEIAYNSAMNYILNLRRCAVSFFTPVYRTPKFKFERLLASVIAQNGQDWEWVIVDDSDDNSKTGDMIKELISSDSRIKYYRFDKPSGGIIGDVKYKAAMLCNGELIAEVDHDDYLMPECYNYLVNASLAHPDCGFFYTNCVEVDDNWNCLKYPKGFAFDYGSYRKTKDDEIGWEYEESVCVGINPKTIRHIVGVPNHIRAWRKELYCKIGGHNRRLSIADDYELIVRTFLNTKFCHIDACGYVQFIYNNDSGQNTHDATRGDIQRRVRTIMLHYNHEIAERFYHLGVTDWAYKYNPNNPLLAPSRFGNQENKVNIVFTPK